MMTLNVSIVSDVLSQNRHLALLAASCQLSAYSFTPKQPISVAPYTLSLPGHSERG
ncbi:hypothetical protein [Dialister invisus]|uniref:hypothetical protein n=1 Tax=Dialister invisus TaxID=218538 RepID=UPI003AF94991